ncbi:hypothetical protein HMPREF1981_01874 [Bacteroides pyogenes F0041]|uniref:Uncharacterized protein n=1 Tax=Bacteroides pyogenes F0041 TaxID=1321819 RepID=U2DUK8_9BACE|nr:hypothetical protein HMPREF1981_01874 [Bacteroides pyogenes F0041]
MAVDAVVGGGDFVPLLLESGIRLGLYSVPLGMGYLLVGRRIESDLVEYYPEVEDAAGHYGIGGGSRAFRERIADANGF